MAVRVDEVASPVTMQEALAFLKRRPDAVLWAGGTLLMIDPGSWPRAVSSGVMDIHRIPELSQIYRSDRHVELGACVPLSRLLAIPKRSILGPLKTAALRVGGRATRNLATLGGNIASARRFMSCFPALSCMDATVEQIGRAHV